MSLRDMASRLAKLERAAELLDESAGDDGESRERLIRQIRSLDAGMSDDDRVAGAEAFRKRFGTTAAFVADLKASLAGGDGLADHSWQPGHMSVLACWVAFASLDEIVDAATV